MTESLGRWRQSLERCFGVFVHLCFLTSFTRLCPSGNVLSDTLPPVGTLDECHTSLDSRVGNAMETVEHNALQCRRDKDASWRDTDVRPHLCVVLAFNQAWFEPGRRCVMVCDPPLQRLIALLGYTNLRRRGKSVNICRLRNEDGVACPGWRGIVDNTGGRNIAVVSAQNTACRRIRRNCHRGRNCDSQYKPGQVHGLLMSEQRIYYVDFVQSDHPTSYCIYRSILFGCYTSLLVWYQGHDT